MDEFKISAKNCRPFGRTGLKVAPLWFGAAAFGDASRPIADATKIALCGEGLRAFDGPIVIDTCADCAGSAGLETIGQILRRLEVTADEVIISHTLNFEGCFDQGERLGHEQIEERWETDCRLLGESYRPKFVALSRPGATDHGLPSSEAGEIDDRLSEALRSAHIWKASGQVAAVGISSREWSAIKNVAATNELDWVRISGGYTLWRHPAERTDQLNRLAEREIAIVNADVFHDGFLIGGPYLDGRAINSGSNPNIKAAAWRRSFAALGQGFGVTAAHAAIQFGLMAPGITAVSVNTSQPKRVAENCRSALLPVPPRFWDAMRDEKLLRENP